MKTAETMTAIWITAPSSAVRGAPMCGSASWLNIGRTSDEKEPKIPSAAMTIMIHAATVTGVGRCTGLSYRCLTVKLRGRTQAPHGAEGAQFLSARGAKPKAHHGPLQ